MQKIRIAYFGTPDFSASFLEKLLTDTSFPIEIIVVVTQPDRPVGRKQLITPSPVKVVAQNYHIPISHQANDILNQHVDLALLFAYGSMIKSDILQAPKHGFWNIHPSLLPKYRGASPITYPLILGDNKTGVTLIQMDEKLDHGSIITQKELEILPNDKNTDLQTKLTDLGYSLFSKSINELFSHSGPLRRSSSEASLSRIKEPRSWSHFVPQDNKMATYTHMLKRQDGYIPLETLKKALRNEPLTSEELPILVREFMLGGTLERDSRQRARQEHWREGTSGTESSINSSRIIFNYFRGLYPWPGIFTLFENKRVKITDVELVDNILIINRIQWEGKTGEDATNFLKMIEI